MYLGQSDFAKSEGYIFEIVFKLNLTKQKKTTRFISHQNTFYHVIFFWKEYRAMLFGLKCVSRVKHSELVNSFPAQFAGLIFMRFHMEKNEPD